MISIQNDYDFTRFWVKIEPFIHKEVSQMDNRIQEIFRSSIEDNAIANELYHTYGVKKGLRNEDGTGVLIGLTRIADVVGYEMIDGIKTDAEGKLFYRGISIQEMVERLSDTPIHGFEETCFLILFGHLPNRQELDLFTTELRRHYDLPEGFLASNILRNPSMNIMNKIQRALLMLYETDEHADLSDVEHTFSQGLQIIAKMPAIACYAYQAKHHLLENKSLIIHPMDHNRSIAENILRLLRTDQHYTREEATLLDLCLILHADHGAGNNSTFTNIVVSSTGTDIYSCFAASVGALKGPRHGGANIRVQHMMQAIIDTIGLDADDAAMDAILDRLLDKDFFDRQGLIYGMGHAVYTLSDPRAVILKKHVQLLAREKHCEDRYDFYRRLEERAKQRIYLRKGIHVSANVDYYSGLVYSLLGIPEDLFTPMFVCARVVGWLAHNIENKLYCNRIVRPAGKYVGETTSYIELEKRD